MPVKFGIDKRKAHLSNLIFSGQISKEEALEELQNPPLSLELQKSDFSYVAKKLDFTEDELTELLTQPNVEHEIYGTDVKLRNFLRGSLLRKIKQRVDVFKEFTS